MKFTAKIDNRTNYERVLDSFVNANPQKLVSPITGHSGMEDKTVRLLEEAPYALASYPFGSHFIGEILNAYHISKFLRMKSAIFIDAQTGAGKTSFVFKILYPLLHEQGKRVLYLGSRSALKEKARYDAIKAAGTDHLERFTPLGLKYEHTFRDIDVFTYQELYNENTALSRKN